MNSAYLTGHHKSTMLQFINHICTHFRSHKFLAGILFISLHLLADGQSKKNLNPTASYNFDYRAKSKKGDVFGSFGEIKIKLLDSSKVAISLYICKGAPSYNSGSFIDTLKYQKNTLIYKTPKEDSTCRIIFTFSNNGVTLQQFQSKINNGCGFGQGVFADGFYKKISSKIPIIEDIEGEFDEKNSNLLKK